MSLTSSRRGEDDANCDHDAAGRVGFDSGALVRKAAAALDEVGLAIDGHERAAGYAGPPVEDQGPRRSLRMT